LSARICIVAIGRAIAAIDRDSDIAARIATTGIRRASFAIIAVDVGFATAHDRLVVATAGFPAGIRRARIVVVAFQCCSRTASAARTLVAAIANESIVSTARSVGHGLVRTTR
jgi:hypothetical protein